MERKIYHMVLFDRGELMSTQEATLADAPSDYQGYKQLQPTRIGVGPDTHERSFWQNIGKQAPMYEWVYQPEEWREYTDPRMCSLIVEGRVERGRAMTAEEAEADPELERTNHNPLGMEVRVISLDDLFGSMGEGDPGDEDNPGIANPFRTPEPADDRPDDDMTPGELRERERQRKAQRGPTDMKELSWVTMGMAMDGHLPKLEHDAGQSDHQNGYPRNFVHAPGCPHLN